MKIMTALSRAQFKQFQTENMDPALNLIGVNLTKFEKRKQLAARMLGYNAYEALSFSSELFERSANEGELIIARHPTYSHLVLIITRFYTLMIEETSGRILEIDEPQLSLRDIVEMDKSFYDDEVLTLEMGFEPKSISLDIDEPKVYSFGLNRLIRLRKEYDWTMRNGMIGTLIIKASTQVVGTPTLAGHTVRMNVSVSMSDGCTDSGHYYCNEGEYDVTLKGNQELTDAMLSYAISQNNDHSHWQTRTHLLAESKDCISIAYAFLDAQQHTKGQRHIDHEIKAVIEKWAGRYVSMADVEAAIRLHPRFEGDATTCNLSKRLVMPSYSRLNGIESAGTKGYCFNEDDWHLGLFAKIETRNGLNTMDEKTALDAQQRFLNNRNTLAFYDWIAQFKNEDTPLGDLATDVLRDKSFPTLASDIRMIRNYLLNQSTDSDYIRTVHEAMQGYEKSR